MADAVRDHELLKELGESLENQILLLRITFRQGENYREADWTKRLIE